MLEIFIKNLTELNGPSGNEDEIREYILKTVKNQVDSYRVDSMGNLITFKKGYKSNYKVMLAAHMDEVGLMITGYGEGGTLKFKPVGGIDDRILIGKRVIAGSQRLPGVIGCKPVHLQEKEERGNNIKYKKMYIDIGAESREEAEKLVPRGEYAVFMSTCRELGNSCIKAKALDDRVGCAILMDILKERYRFDLYTCFTVQEEVGLRGAETAAYSIEPDLAIVIEGTTCSDVPEVEEYSQSTVLGAGAVLTVADRTAYADKKLVDYIYRTALSEKIKVQFKRTATGGNDAGKIQRSKKGVKVASISVPCRYIHSPSSIMSREDLESCRRLLKAVLDNLGKDDADMKSILNGGNTVV
jgi:putative aminopeptidase FrvX